MSEDTRLREILARRDEMRRQGETVDLEVLCADCPELLPVLMKLTGEGTVADSSKPGQVAVTPDPWYESTGRPLPAVPGFEILGELGRGGMGVVYKARQVKLNRLVALKMILAGAHAGPQTRARFALEAEAVARLQHPNIVQVHEVGEHDHCPYLALEFVDGGGLETKLQGKPQDPHDSAHLVEMLARAMHVAHLHGIVHRDLKPANILVASGGRESPGSASGGRESNPEKTSQGTHAKPPLTRDSGSLLAHIFPKISDFGLAKQIEGESHTCSGAVLGTPNYMAPEQALGKVHQVGPPADVYALGAILYECLTGEPPFRAPSTPEILTLVQTQEVKPPSQLRKEPLPRDLETICVKCLQKDPGRRYATAEALANDLHRFLNQEPILARPTGRIERLRMWARRKPAAAGLVAVCLLAVASLVGLGVWSHVKVQSALQRAESNLERAQEAINVFYVEFADQWLDETAKMDEKQARFLNLALEHYRKLAEQESDDPDLWRGQGLAWFRVGRIQNKLGEQAEALEAFANAIRIQSALVRSQPQDPQYRKDLAETHNWRGELFRTTNRSGEAESDYREAMRLQEALAKGSPENPAYRHELGRSHYNLGLVLSLKDKPRAQSEHERAIELLKQVVSEWKTENGKPREEPTQDLARAFLNQGVLLESVNDYPEAKKAYLEAVRRLNELRLLNRSKPDYRHELATTLNNLGNLEGQKLKNLAAAGKALAEAQKLLGELVEDYPGRPLYTEELANICNSQGALLFNQKKYERAEESWRSAAELFQRLVERDAENAQYLHRKGMVHGNLGFLYLDHLSKPAEAVQELEISTRALRKAANLRPEDAGFGRLLVLRLRSLARGCRQLGDLEHAARIAEEVTRARHVNDEDRYAAAVLLAECAEASLKDTTEGSSEEKQRRSRDFADRALRVLSTVDPDQCKKAREAARDPRLNILAEREDFRRLLARWHETHARP